MHFIYKYTKFKKEKMVFFYKQVKLWILEIIIIFCSTDDIKSLSIRYSLLENIDLENNTKQNDNIKMGRRCSVAYNLKIETKGQRMFISYIIAPYFIYIWSFDKQHLANAELNVMPKLGPESSSPGWQHHFSRFKLRTQMNLGQRTYYEHDSYLFTWVITMSCFCDMY